MDRRTFIRGAVMVGAGIAVRNRVPGALFSTAEAATTPFRAFSDSSEWNRPLPINAPIDPASSTFIGYLKGIDPNVQYPRLVDGKWAEPIYWARDGDPEYAISPFPFRVRIPANAVPAATSDAQLTVYDVARGYVIKLQKATFTGTTWTARWTAIYYLASNGLFGKLPESDDPRNRGHRGYPPPLHAVRWDEIQMAEIRHVLKVAIKRTASQAVYPGAAHEGGSGVIPEGAILRIKPSVDLTGRGLTPAALVVAKAMQNYGVVVGDQSGVPMALKLENLAAVGTLAAWSDARLNAKSLSSIRFDDLECIKLGYHRP